MTFAELEQKMYDYRANGQDCLAEIVFSNDSPSWNRHDFTIGERTYRTMNNTWGWDRSKIGHCRWGVALEGDDSMGIRLDDQTEDWIVESCRIVEVWPASFITGGAV